MKYGNVDGLGLVSRLVFGGMNPLLMGGRQKEASVLLDKVFDRGINAFDLARVYGMGMAEKSFGVWMKTKKREEIVLETKCCHPNQLFRFPRVSKKCAKADIEASLKALDTDYVDLLLLHRDDENVPAEEIITFMNELIDEGKVRAVGVSNWEKERIEQANSYALAHSLKPFVVSSPQFSLAVEVRHPWMGHTVSLSGDEREADRAFYQETQFPVFAFSSLAGGFMTGKYSSETVSLELKPAWVKKAFLDDENVERLRRAEVLAKEKGVTVSQIALAWTMQQGMNLFNVLTFSSEKRIKENLGCCDLVLTEEESDWLNLKV